MAEVTYNRSIKSFHGAVGRMVFYERNGQALVRSKGKRKKPRSGAQLVSQEAFRRAAALWSEFSAQEKEPWRIAGKGEGITGYNAFLKENIPRLRRGEPVVSVPAVRPGAQQIGAGDAQFNEKCLRFMEEMRLLVRRAAGDARRSMDAAAAASGPGPCPRRYSNTFSSAAFVQGLPFASERARSLMNLQGILDLKMIMLSMPAAPRVPSWCGAPKSPSGLP